MNTIYFSVAVTLSHVAVTPFWALLKHRIPQTFFPLCKREYGSVFQFCFELSAVSSKRFSVFSIKNKVLKQSIFFVSLLWNFDKTPTIFTDWFEKEDRVTGRYLTRGILQTKNVLSPLEWLNVNGGLCNHGSIPTQKVEIFLLICEDFETWRKQRTKKLLTVCIYVEQECPCLYVF